MEILLKNRNFLSSLYFKEIFSIKSILKGFPDNFIFKGISIFFKNIYFLGNRNPLKN
jgi:hypothetical protein